ncbi:MAG TPA: hypothetical protein VK395_15170 [Gemmataceae bacterium]|nr:hypothetical protein [Gemmataceae bacterium]
MRGIFADSFHWIALASPADAWHAEARRLTEALAGVPLITTEEVLIEFLNWFSKRGSASRRQGAALVRGIMGLAHVQVMPQTHEGFVAALDLYEKRMDKQYSMTDCISMNTMRSLGISEVLTHDEHSRQDGFHILFERTH